MRLTLSRAALSLRSSGMRVPRAFGSVVVATALVLGCGRTYDNPFAGSRPTTPPPAAAAIVYSSNAHDPRPAGGRELYAVEESGANPTRLTFCAADGAVCSTLDAAFDADRRRAVVRRVLADSDSDGTLTEADGEGLYLVDFDRSVQGEILPANARVSSVDWSAISDVIVYSGVGSGGANEDLFRMDPNGQNNRNISVSQGIRERHPRVDPTGSVAVFERIDGSGKGQIYVFITTQALTRVTSGGDSGPALPSTPYIVGSDADPDYSPDGRSIAFRRLTALGDGRNGHWDVMTVRTDGSGLTTIASGPAWRDGPDWGPNGIVFSERGPSGRTELVVVNPDGTNRRAIVAVAPGVELRSARWLP